MADRPSYKALLTIFSQQCEVIEDKVKGARQDRRQLHAEPI